MTTPVYMVIACVVAYLVGGIPFGYIIGRVAGGIDIRTQGSGNIGATNVARVMGFRWGVAVLVPDAMKGLLPVLAVSATMSRWVASIEPGSVIIVHLQVLVGLIAIVGHMFPCWLGLRGGKGVATALGVAVILGPWATLVAVGVYLLSLATSRMGSLSSLLASLAFAIVQTVLMVMEHHWAERWSLSAFALAVPFLIIYRHRSNIGRIIRGEEMRIGQRDEASQAESDSGSAEQVTGDPGEP